ncbi:MAG: L-aspartate oxidase [Actinobacteria bacterium]|nr:L-aspartate oxidase [Actinomycetota bacterium]
MQKRYLIDLSQSRKTYDCSDCIIIGSGIAGLSTAIRISRYTKVKVLTKSSLSESTTWYAQGGIAAAIKKPDKWKNHYEDTIKAGQGLCDTKAVKVLVKYAPKMIEDLIELGITFDISDGEIGLTTEGGHSYPRILHAGGDATGEEIEKKLVKYSKNFGQIEFYPEYLVLDIITADDICLGVIALNLTTSAIEIHPAKNIIIASGGIGQLFDLTTNPQISTGDGIAMAYRAGASIKDIEFMQFHPTVFKTNEGSLYLITEALRGEGAYLRDSFGKRFMVGIHPRAELAPRDIVVKEMIKVMKDQNIKFVHLDATHLPENMLKVRFPNIVAKLKDNGLILSKDLIKVFPAAHYLNGGIKTDLKGHTDIRGLYACGETAATGAHGANRLASNSLIEGLVYGWEISKDVIKKLKSDSLFAEQKLLKKLDSILTGQGELKAETKLKMHDNKLNKDLEKTTLQFRHLMSEKVGILRDDKSLAEALTFINKNIKNSVLFNNPDKKAVELINMLTVGYLIAAAARLRKESRGTHQRNDYFRKDDKNWKKHIILKRDNISFEPVE